MNPRSYGHRIRFLSTTGRGCELGQTVKTMYIPTLPRGSLELASNTTNSVDASGSRAKASYYVRSDRKRSSITFGNPHHRTSLAGPRRLLRLAPFLAILYRLRSRQLSGSNMASPPNTSPRARYPVMVMLSREHACPWNRRSGHLVSLERRAFQSIFALVHTSGTQIFPNCGLSKRNTSVQVGLSLIRANQYPTRGEVRHLQNAEIADMPRQPAR